MQEIENSHKNVNQYLSFTLGGEEYGVNILRVKEIREWQGARLLPGAPDYVKGVLDLRGRMVPIFDLRIRFGLPDVSYEPPTVVVILSLVSEGRDYVIGAIVDGVSDVLDVEPTAVLSAPAMEQTIGARYLMGMVTIAQRMVILLDVDRLLEPAELDELVRRDG